MNLFRKIAEKTRILKNCRPGDNHYKDRAETIELVGHITKMEGKVMVRRDV